MVSVGQEFSNAQSGERFVMRATRESTGGEYCEFDLYLAPGAKLAAPHSHPLQEERFTVVSGSMKLVIGKDSSLLAPGDVGVIPPQTGHNWGNVSDEGSHVIVRLTPALRSEDYFEEFCAIATAGKAGSSGLPRNPLQLAVLLDSYRDEFAFATRGQHAVLSPVLSAVAALGRVFGVRSGPPVAA